MPRFWMVQLWLAALALFSVVASLPGSKPECLSALAPPTNSRGVNRVNKQSNTPLFQLQLLPNQTSSSFTVQITLKNDLLAFSDAKISLEALGPCGSGQLIFGSQSFFETKQNDPDCPRLLLTNKKSPMTQLPALQWIPPSCGCVQFRALVLESGEIYYADRPSVSNGALSQTVCVERTDQREQYLEALCLVNERYSAAEILSRMSFLKRHQLESRWMDRHGLEIAIELRRSDNRLCCTQNSPKSKMTCFDDTRRRRVDRFCEDGYPDIPFTSFRLDHMRQREKNCCFILGEHRYSCFADGSARLTGSSAALLDFSTDETDPVNDLSEMATEKDTDILPHIRTVRFGDEDGDSAEEMDETEINTKGDVVNEKDGIEDRDDDNRDDDKDIVETLTREVPTASLLDDKANREESFDVSEDIPYLEANHAKFDVPVDRKATQPKVFEASETGRAAGSMTDSEPRKGSRKMKWSEERRTSGREIPEPERRASLAVPERQPFSFERRLPAYTDQEDRFPDLERDLFERSGLSRERDTLPSRSPYLTSAERRARLTASAQRRFDWPGAVEETNFDDQGGASVDETLNKLTKKMERLRLKQRCCEHGAKSGSHVYGIFRHVLNECEHSAEKFMHRIGLTQGRRACGEQFRRCCIEQAESGPPLTSSEFRDADFLYQRNLGTLDPSRDVPEVRDEEDFSKTATTAEEEEAKLARKGVGREMPGRETPEAYELESERRFESMRNPVNNEEEEEDDDEIDGPTLFDEVDNVQENFDVLDRKQKTDVTEELSKPKEGNEETENKGLYDDRTFVGDDIEDTEDDDYDILGRNAMDLAYLGSKNSGKRKVAEDLRRHEGASSRTELDLDRAIQRVSGPTELEEPYRPLVPPHTPRRSRTSRKGGRSRGHRSRQSMRQTSRGRASRRGSRERASRRGSKEQGRASRRGSKERRQSEVSRHNYLRSFPTIQHGRVRTLDSKEMAAAHAKTFTKTMDSREMAESYRQVEPSLAGYRGDQFTGWSSSGRRRHYSRRKNW